MSKYSSDDNRSMQLNDNNERYYSSRGYDYDDDDDYEEENLKKPCLNVDEDGYAKYFYQYIDALAHDLHGPRFQFNIANQEHRGVWFYYMVRAARDWCSSTNRNPDEYQLIIPHHLYDNTVNFEMINDRIKNHVWPGLEAFKKNWLITPGCHGYIPITSENGLKNE